MWRTFLKFYNCRALLRFPPIESSATLNFYTDASFLGAGCVFGESWFQIIFPKHWQSYHITFLELYPIIVAAHIFIGKLANKSVIFHTDNYGVMSMLNKCTSPNPKFMLLLRKLALLSLQYNFRFSSKHLPGIENNAPDIISRLQVTGAFLEKYGLRTQPVKIPTYWSPSVWEQQVLAY